MLSMEGGDQITADQMAQVQASWVHVKALDESYEAQGVILFRHIFTIAPQALPLFPFKDETDLYNSDKLKKHGKNVVKHVERAITDFEGMNDALDKLGGRHKGYGILPEHFDIVGQALILTLGDALGDKFTDELKAIWVKVYALLTKTMKGNHYD